MSRNIRNECRLRAARNLSITDRYSWFAASQQLLVAAFGDSVWLTQRGAISTVNVYEECRGINYSLLRPGLHAAMPVSSQQSLEPNTTGLLRMSRRGRIHLAVRLELPELIQESAQATTYLLNVGLNQVSRNKTAPHMRLGSIPSEEFNQQPERASEILTDIRSLLPPTTVVDPVHYIVRND